MGKRADVLMEKHSLTKLRHPNIVRLISTFTDTSCAYVVTERMHDELWNRCKRSGISADQGLWVVEKLCEALSFVHRNGIAHRDLKCENVLVSEDFKEVKLADFGTSRDFLNSQLEFSTTKSSLRKHFTHFVGTPQFMAPEAMNNKENDRLSDFWSFGCLIYQLFFGIPPFHAPSEYYVFLRIKALDLQFPENSIQVGISQIVVDIIRDLCKEDRETRITLSEVVLKLRRSETEFLSDSLQEKDDREKARSLSYPVKAGEISLPAEISQPKIITLVNWVRKWEFACRPGSGSEALAHLNLPDI
jgi:3-phosphoinositide dependent protein kinase-1